MKLGPAILLFALAVAIEANGQAASVSVPASVVAGTSFSIATQGSGAATLYILGMGQVFKRDIQLGQPVQFEAGALYSTGRYVAILSSGDSSTSSAFNVLPESKPSDLNFLAKPSRLPVSAHEGITGTAYVLDAYRNLLTTPVQVQFELSGPTGAVQTHTIATHNGAAWTAFDSTPQQGTDKFVVRVGDVSSARVIRQVPGDPCGLKMTAQQSGKLVQLKTDPVRDCNGNAVPDGTVVTFTEAFDGDQSTADVPLKKGFAQVEMPFHSGAMISVASGVALGNQIRLEK